MKKLFTLALSMLALSSFAQVLNPGMEDWHNYTANGTSLTAPDDWHGSDEVICWADTGIGGALITPAKQIYRSTSANNGTYAARIETKQILLLGNGQSGALSTANMMYAGIFILDGGTPVTEQIPFVYAWAKYSEGSGGADTGMLLVTAVVTGSNGDSVVGTGVTDILPSATYSQIGTVVQYTDANVVPEKLQITFYSSKSIINGQDGSQLWVDDVTWSTSSVKALAQNNVVKCYPNPSGGLISVYNTLNEAVTMKVFTINGQQVAEKKFKGNDVIDLTAQANGLYFFTILDNNGQPVQNGKLTVAK
jgi:hypothetical protein